MLEWQSFKVVFAKPSWKGCFYDIIFTKMSSSYILRRFLRNRCRFDVVKYVFSSSEHRLNKNKRLLEQPHADFDKVLVKGQILYDRNTDHKKSLWFHLKQFFRVGTYQQCLIYKFQYSHCISNRSSLQKFIRMIN